MDGADPFATGNDAAARGAFADAIAAYRAALRTDPAHVGALNNLGTLLRIDGQPIAAVACLKRALALGPRPGTLVNLALALLELHRPDEAATSLRTALDLDPDLAEAWSTLGGAELARDDPDTALEAFRHALALAPDLLPARFGEALALLTRGEWRAGWAAYECRLDDPAQAAARRSPAWRGEPVAGCTVLLRAEQGFGDTIQFARYIPLVAALGARVRLEVPLPLVALLAPLVSSASPLEDVDFACMLMSLPHLLGTERSLTPGRVPPAPLTPGADRVASWAARLGAAQRPRIGIAFSGRETHVDDALRSLPAIDLVAALSGGQAELHVVQTDLRAPDRAALAPLPWVKNHCADLADFADTAALLVHMDLVVSVDTAIAHLAATLGRPTWILLQRAADFRWQRRRLDTPWYPSARLLRQRTPGDWAGVLDTLASLERAWEAGRMPA